VRAFWTVLILLLGPVAGFAGGRKLRVVSSRKLIYVSNAINLAFVTGITAAIDYTHGQTALRLLARVRPERMIRAWRLGVAVACVAVVTLVFWARILLHRPPKSTIIALLPRSVAEKIGFVLLCAFIGLAEEFIYRGFALAVLRQWFQSDLLAVAMVALSFALMHGLQDFVAIISAFAQGILLSLPVLAVESLIPAIVAHVVVDAFAGLFMLHYLRQAGMLPAPVAPQT
jgi:membrane protease YdiL (CAAX protease family)